ncbi:H-NS histone family protein [Thioclava kandeliae]|uniref:H-NS histone family protein n=1 Tax=Thioclava kandeliae TaxID=3070818 RepID=A0ABV1SM40_9RHOB
MKHTDLRSLSFDDLLQLQKDVEVSIQNKRASDLVGFVERFLSEGAELGYSAQEVVAKIVEKSDEKIHIPRKSPKGKKVYHHPEDPKITWNGLGRRPSWVVSNNVKPTEK